MSTSRPPVGDLGAVTTPAAEPVWDEPLAPRNGDEIAGFRIEAELGRGGMATVYRATQLSLARPVALKLLLPEHALRDGARERFAREAKVAAALRHPNAIEIYDHGAFGPYTYLAMELLDGEPLRSIVSEELPALPPARILSILERLADVLVAAHGMSLVHRDLKPENVFLHREADGSERLVVLDFGLAFIRGDEDVGRKTSEGMISGTPDYLSPEQAQGHDVGLPSDIYSLGCMAYELWTRRVPFLGHPMHVLTKHMYSAPIEPSRIARDVVMPAAFEELVMAMLRKVPAERPTASEVRSVLRGLSGASHFERARERIGLDGRAARMVSTIRPARTVDAPAAVDGDAVMVAVLGSLPGDLVLALAVNGLVAYVASDEQPVAGAHAIFAPHTDAAGIAALKAEHRLPVITDVAPGDVATLATLMRAGADEVLPRPVRAEELARRVARAVRKARMTARRDG